MSTVTVSYEIPDSIDAKEFVNVVTDSESFNTSYVAFLLELKDGAHLSIPVSYSWGMKMPPTVLVKQVWSYVK